MKENIFSFYLETFLIKRKSNFLRNILYKKKEYFPLCKDKQHCKQAAVKKLQKHTKKNYKKIYVEQTTQGKQLQKKTNNLKNPNRGNSRVVEGKSILYKSV